MVAELAVAEFDIETGKMTRKSKAATNSVVKDLNRLPGPLGRIGGLLNGPGGVVAGIAAMGAGIGVTIGDTIRFGDQMDKMSRRTGITVETLSELNFAAQQSGTNIQAVEQGYARISRVILDAELGLKSAHDVFDQLNIDWRELRELDPAARLERIADAFAALPSEERVGVARLLGRQIQALLPLLDGGAKGLRDLRQEARDTGNVMDRATAEAAAKAADEFNRLRNQVTGLSREIGTDLLPQITGLIDAGNTLFKLYRENRDTIGDAIGGERTGDALEEAGIKLPTPQEHAAILRLRERGVEVTNESIAAEVGWANSLKETDAALRENARAARENADSKRELASATRGTYTALDDFHARLRSGQDDFIAYQQSGREALSGIREASGGLFGSDETGIGDAYEDAVAAAIESLRDLDRVQQRTYDNARELMSDMRREVTYSFDVARDELERELLEGEQEISELQGISEDRRRALLERLRFGYNIDRLELRENRRDELYGLDIRADEAEGLSRFHRRSVERRIDSIETYGLGGPPRSAPVPVSIVQPVTQKKTEHELEVERLLATIANESQLATNPRAPLATSGFGGR